MARKYLCPGCDKIRKRRQFIVFSMYLPADGGTPVKFWLCASCGKRVLDSNQQEQMLEHIEMNLKAGRRLDE